MNGCVSVRGGAGGRSRRVSAVTAQSALRRRPLPTANVPRTAARAVGDRRMITPCVMCTHLPWWVLAAELSHPVVRPLALRPRLAPGLPLSAVSCLIVPIGAPERPRAAAATDGVRSHYGPLEQIGLVSGLQQLGDVGHDLGRERGALRRPRLAVGADRGAALGRPSSRSTASTTAGSNWWPASRRSSSRASLSLMAAR